MHKSSMLRMEWFVKNYLLSSVSQSKSVSVLDIGSYDVNGCYKTFFQNPRFIYKGLDMESGPNVDIVVETPYHWPMLQDESFDVIICGQALEHIEFFWLTLREISRVLKRGGIICIIAPRGFKRHRYPVDCYRFDTDGMLALAKYINFKPLHASMNLAPMGASPDWYSINDVTADAMLIAEKPIDWSGEINPKNYVFEQNDLNALATGFIEMPNYNSQVENNISIQFNIIKELNDKDFNEKVLRKDNIAKEINNRMSHQDNVLKELENKISNQNSVIEEIRHTLHSHDVKIDENQRWIVRFRYSAPYKIIRKLRSLFREH